MNELYILPIKNVSAIWVIYPLRIESSDSNFDWFALAIPESFWDEPAHMYYISSNLKLNHCLRYEIKDYSQLHKNEYKTKLGDRYET